MLHVYNENWLLRAGTLVQYVKYVPRKEHFSMVNVQPPRYDIPSPYVLKDGQRKGNSFGDELDLIIILHSTLEDTIIGGCSGYCQN